MCPLQDSLTAPKRKGRCSGFWKFVLWRALRKPTIVTLGQCDQYPLLLIPLWDVCTVWQGEMCVCWSWFAWLDHVFFKSASFGLWLDDLSSVLERSSRLGWSAYITQGCCRLPSGLECGLLLLLFMLCIYNFFKLKVQKGQLFMSYLQTSSYIIKKIKLSLSIIVFCFGWGFFDVCLCVVCCCFFICFVF